MSSLSQSSRTWEPGTPEDDSSQVITSRETLRYAVSLCTIDSGVIFHQLFPDADRIKCTLRVRDKSYSFESWKIYSEKPVKWKSWETVEVPDDVVNPNGNNSEKNVEEIGDSNASADSGVHEAKNNTMVILEMTGGSASSTENKFTTLVGEIEAAKLFHPCGASYRCSFREKDENVSFPRKSIALIVFSSPLDEDLNDGLTSLRVYVYECAHVDGYKAAFLHTYGEETVQESKYSHGGIVSFQAKNISGLRITSGPNTVAVHLKDIKNTTIPSWHSGIYVSAYCPYSVCKSALGKFERLGKIFVRVQPQLEKVDKALMANVSSRDAVLELLSSTGGAIRFTSEEAKSDFLDALESDGMGGVDTEGLIQLLDDLDKVIVQCASGVPPETREEALQRILARLLLAVLLPNPERRTQETESVLAKKFVNEQRRTSNQANPATQPTMPDLDYELRSFKESLEKNLEDLVALHEAIHVPESCFDIMYMRAFSNAFYNASDVSIKTKLLQAARRSDFKTCERILQTHPEINPLSARESPICRGKEKSVSAMQILSFGLDRLQVSYPSSLDYLIAAIARMQPERNVYGLVEGSKNNEMYSRFKAAKLQDLQSARDLVALILERGRDISEFRSDTFARALRSFDVKTLQLMVRNEKMCRAVNQTEAWKFIFSNWRSHSYICSELADVLLAVQVANVSHQALSCSESGVFHCPNDTTSAAETLHALFRQRLGDRLTLGILHKLLKTRQCKSDDILISLFSQAVNSSTFFEDYSPFLIACKLGYTECVQEFISHGADVDLHAERTGQSALQVAVENRRIEILRILCKSGASYSSAITKDGKTPLHLAIEMKCPEMVAVLCENGAESDDKALLCTTELGHGEILQILKNDGKASPERYRGELDRTLLHLACNKPDAGDDNFVQMLIQMNVAVNEVDMIGRTALHNAAAMGNLSAVRSLLEAGADETLPTRREGSTVIHEAAKMGRISVLQFVLKNSSGETVDAVDMKGRTPLCYAFKRRRFLELTFYCLRELQESAQEMCLRECHLAPEMEEFAQLMKRRYRKFDSSFRETIDSADALRGIGSTREMVKLASLIKKCFQESENHELSTEDLQKIEFAPETKAFVGWIKKSYRALDASSHNLKEVELSEVVRDLHLLPLMRQFVYLIIRSYEEPSMLDPEKKEGIPKSLGDIEKSNELKKLAALIKRRIDVADTSCKTANEIRVFKSNLKLVSGSAFSPYTRFECLPNFDGELLSYFPQDICQDLQDLKTGFKDEEGLQATLLDCFEELFVEIRKADAVLGILLDAGADIDHVDDQGNPAFDDDYRIEYFKTREKELRAALEKRSKLAHDQPIFKGKIVHHAVHAAWVQQGLRFKACRALAYWVILLILLTLVAIRYSGRDVYESFSIQASIVNRMSSGDVGNLEDIKDLDSWNDYVETVFVDAIWPSESALRVGTDTVMFGDGLVLLGRPRYRQIRTRADSCSTTMPSLLSEAETPCYAPYSRGTFSSLDATIEDRSPYACMLSDAESHVISWEDSPAVPFFGKFGFYKGGGSSVVLLSNKTATQQLLQDLRACEFISMGTRLAALEITLYSRSHELFVHGRVFMEHTTTGGVFANQRWETRKLVSYESTEDRHQVWMEVVMVLFFLGHFFSEIYRLLVSTCRFQKVGTDGASEQTGCKGDDYGSMPNLNKLRGVVVLDPEEQQWWLCNVSKTRGSSRSIISMDHSRSFALEQLKWIETWGSESGPRRFIVGELVHVSKGPGREECFGFIVSVNECDKRWTYSVLNPEDKSGGSRLNQNIPEDAIKAEPGVALTVLRRCGSTKDPSSDAKSPRRSEREKCQRDSFRPRSWISGAQKVWQSIQVDGIVKTCALVVDDLPAYWSDPFNYLDLSIIFLFFGLVATHIKLIHGAAQRSSDWLENAERDVYIDVSDLMWLSTVRQYLLGGVVFLCYLKTLEYLRVAATFAVPVMIIIGMLLKLMSFLAILAVFVLAFGIFDYVVFGLKYAPVNSVMKALVFTLRGALGELDFDGKYEMDQVVGTGMTMLAAVLLVILLLNLLIAVMSEAYEDVKATAEARWCYRQYMAIYRRQEKEELSQWVFAKGINCWRILCRRCEPFRAYLGPDWSGKDGLLKGGKWPGGSSRVTPSDTVGEESQVKSA